ncbi:sigma-70 region 4 domain-containing protein [Streptomyces sp. NPDC023838]|uniref:sigma-70 region 4 domain-containing protein n=1 Tax=Streptomyces sp. NPDC023838 TaxID=3154325 RepID=UPI0033DDE194
MLTGNIQFCTAVGRLSERQRDAVILRYGLDCTTKEAAAVMGVEEATIRSHLSQACRRLAQLLDVPAKPSGEGKAHS